MGVSRSTVRVADNFGQMGSILHVGGSAPIHK